MPTLLLAAAKLGYQADAFRAAAARLGVDLILVSDRCHRLEDPWGDHAVPFVEASAIEAADGVLAIGDRPAIMAATVAARLGLRFHPLAAIEAARNKFLARERFRGAGLPVPRYVQTSAAAEPQSAFVERLTFPVVLKPLGLSGSRGVIRADNAAEFYEAFARIRRILASPDIRQQRDPADRFIQVEEYIPGIEYALEGVLSGGTLTVLALFDKPDPLEGPFFEETIYVTPSRAEPQRAQSIVDAVSRAAKALGLSDGPIHAEVRWNDAGPWVLEVAGRPIGGLCARTLRFAGEETLESVLIRHALGLPCPPLTLEGGAAGVMMIPIPRNGYYEGVTGVDEAKAVASIEDVVITAQVRQRLRRLPEGSSYLGFLFSRAPNPEDAEAALRRAHACLQFQIGEALPVL